MSSCFMMKLLQLSLTNCTDTEPLIIKCILSLDNFNFNWITPYLSLPRILVMWNLSSLVHLCLFLFWRVWLGISEVLYVYLYSPRRRFFSSLVNFSMANIFNILHLKIKYVIQGPILYPLLYSVLKRIMKLLWNL